MLSAQFRHNHTLVQHLQISRSEGTDFTDQIESQLRERLNVNPSRMVVRNFKVGEVARDGNVKQEVICMAVSRDAAMKHIEIAQRAKLDVVGMHCEPVAILNAFDHLFRNPEDKERTICFIDIGGGDDQGHGRPRWEDLFQQDHPRGGQPLYPSVGRGTRDGFLVTLAKPGSPKRPLKGLRTGRRPNQPQVPRPPRRTTKRGRCLWAQPLWIIPKARAVQRCSIA